MELFSLLRFTAYNLLQTKQWTRFLVGSTEQVGLSKIRLSYLKNFFNKMETSQMNDNNVVIHIIGIPDKFIGIDCCSYIKCYVAVWHIKCIVWIEPPPFWESILTSKLSVQKKVRMISSLTGKTGRILFSFARMEVDSAIAVSITQVLL